MKNRVREIRKHRGMTLEELAEKSGLSAGQISKIENNKRGWSVESLEALADALGVTIAHLISAGDVWQNVPVFGAIAAEGVVLPCEKSKGKRPPKPKAPLAFGDLLALIVTGDSLYPRYIKGSTIFCTKDAVSPADCLEKECLVQLDNGVSKLRIVHAGTVKGKYNLVIHNQTTALNQAIVACRPVVYSTPAE